MIESLIAALVCATQVAAAPSTAPAAGSPERAYADFVAAVRDGKVDDALRLTMPAGAANRPFFAAQYRSLHEIESLKAAALKRFPGDDSAMALANTGMVSADTVASAQAKVAGDVATITMVAPDSHQREGAAINLARVDGRWLVSPFDAAGTGLSDEDEKDELADAAKVVRETAEYDAMARQVAALQPRLARGEFADAEAVVDAMMRATMPAR